MLLKLTPAPLASRASSTSLTSPGLTSRRRSAHRGSDPQGRQTSTFVGRYRGREAAANSGRHRAVLRPEQLLGRKIAVVANLKPRKMRGHESQGMLLAASVGDEGKPVIATFTEDVPNGARLK